ncbi:MAG: peptidase M24 [Gemmatimonadales bacterium]|nr:putative dipeptidase PepE [bacterium HR33]GIW52673.1 MAG: peptidase M24 [Gemmatimonadales bacterium]
MALLDRIDLNELSASLKSLNLDGWLLYDFHGINPIARRVTGLGGLVTRRSYVWLPATGAPVILVHRIELSAVRDFPGEVRSYTTWQELERELASIVRGRRVAMETAPEGAVPYLDRVPAGALRVLERMGAVVRSSAPLVSRFAARWSQAELEEHKATAEILRSVALAVLGEAVREAGRLTERELQRRVVERLRAAGVEITDPPIVAFGANSAMPHYEPGSGGDVVLREGDVVLLDLWGRRSPGGVFADQTWMAFAGSQIPDDVARAWEAVRAARDAVIERLRSAHLSGGVLTGAELDAVAREVLARFGFGDAILHRTGHSIDAELHGSGPHLDGFETNDTRELIPGLGFSVEPAVYLEEKFGMRSEVNVYLGPGGPEVTPAEIQRELVHA